MPPLPLLLLALACDGQEVQPAPDGPSLASLEFTARSAPSQVSHWEGPWTVSVYAAAPESAGAQALARGLGVQARAWDGRRPAVAPGQLAALWVPAGEDPERLAAALQPTNMKDQRGQSSGGAVVVVLAPSDAAWRTRALDRLPRADLGLVDPVASAALWAAAPKLEDEAAGAIAADALADSFTGLHYTPVALKGLPPGLAQHLGAPAATDDADPRVRAEAARADAASLLHDPQVSVRLVVATKLPDSLAADPEPLVRARVAEHTRDPEILARLAADPSSVVRVIATHNLARMAAEGARDPALYATLARAAGAPDAYQRWKAAYGLSYFPEGREVLIGLLRDDPDIDVRREAAYALSRHRGPEVRDALLRGLRDDNSFVRRWSAYALGHIGDPTVSDALREAAKEPTALVASEAALALRQYGVQAPIPDFRGLVEAPSLAEAERLALHPDATLRKDLCKALIRLPESARLLLLLARDPDSEVRKAAVEALGWIDDPGIDLSAALSDPDPDTVVAALEAVRQGRSASTGALRALLDHRDTEIRLRSAEALAAAAGRGVSGAAEALLRVVTDPDERVRAAVISVHPARLEEDEPAVLVRLAAVRAGAKLGGDELLLNIDDPDLAARAAGVLAQEDELLHLRFSWNRPEDQPASHRALRPPSLRPYGHPNRG